MSMGIQICGLNGSGKSTLGRALAEAISFHFIDNEQLYFSRKDEKDVYTNAKSREDVERLLLEEVEAHSDFVFAAVKGDYGKEVVEKYRYVILVEVPQEIRSQRVRNRSFQKFGDRMLPGGDLYEQEEAFFRMAEARKEEYVEKWIRTLDCPVIRVDGTKSVQENVDFIMREIGRIGFHSLRY